MAQSKETKLEENKLSTPFQDNSESIVKSKAVPVFKSIIQPKVGPHTRALGNPKKEGTTNTSVTTQLPEEVQAKMENSFGQNFSNVNIHKDSSSAKDINAKAYAQGTDIHFAPGEYNPHSKEGQELIGHELTHVVQQGQGKVGQEEIHGKGLSINQDVSLEKEADEMGKRAADGTIIDNFKNQNISQFKSTTIQGYFLPEDAASEMIGMEFIVSEAINNTTIKLNIPKGTKISIITWDNKNEFVTASYLSPIDKKTYSFKISKMYLRPVKNASGLDDYATDVGAQATSVKDGKTMLTVLEAKEPEYQKFHNQKGYDAEHIRIETLNTNRMEELNKRLIQETMYNRFDSSIVKWVNYYNAQFKPKTLLDANIVKSLFYEETKLGTTGQHLEVGPYSWSSGQKNPIRSKYNLGQSIDSWGPEQYLMIKEMAPAIYKKYKLESLEKESIWKGMTNNEFYSWSGGDFWKAMQEFSNTKDSKGKDFMGNASGELYLDYEFWIRTAIRWLFEKYNTLTPHSWDVAVKAYNGDGPQAQAYKDRIFNRAKSK
jgi:hypothetical protein